MKMDTSGRGVITISQFETIFNDEVMRAFFEAIENDAVDAWTLFAAWRQRFSASKRAFLGQF